VCPWEGFAALLLEIISLLDIEEEGNDEIKTQNARTVR
jgi:hypothetical protein